MRNLFLGSIFVIIGILLLLDNLEIADYREIIGKYWPLLIVLWGFSLLRRKQNLPLPVIEATPITQDLLHQSSVFGDIDLKNSSQNFKGGSISTVFSDCNLDFSDATIAEGEHELRLHGVFGDSIIILPKNVAVSITASTLFGNIAIQDKKKGGFSSELTDINPDFANSPNRLKINISIVFGDIRVI